MSKLKITVSALALTAFASSAFAADFGVLDANTDGQVTFAEYAAVAVTEGKTKTLAAQEFTRMAQGDAVLTQDEFFLAEAMADQPYALQSITVDAPLVTEPMPFEPVVESVAPVETFESYPAEVEAIDQPAMIEPPVEAPVEDTAPAETTEGFIDQVDPVMTETPLETESAVAGEVVTSDDVNVAPMDDMKLEDMPLEEGVNDLDDPEMEMPDIEAPELDTSDIETDIVTDDDAADGDIY